MTDQPRHNHEARKLLTDSIDSKTETIVALAKEADGFDRRARTRRDEAGTLDAEIHGLEIALEGLGGRLDDE